MRYNAGSGEDSTSQFYPVYAIFGDSKRNIKKSEALIYNASERLGEKIRTSGLLNPIQARYQTAPHPETDQIPQHSGRNLTTQNNISWASFRVNTFVIETKKYRLPTGRRQET